MDDILKEAIADAKALRATALENAKIALEEAFTPRLKNMLSQKIQSEVEHEDEVEEDAYSEEEVEDGHEVSEEEHEMSDEDEEAGEEFAEDEEGGEEDVVAAEDAEVEEDEVEGDDDLGDDEAEDDDDEGEEVDVPVADEEEGDLDLESVIKELEDELAGEEDVEEDEEGGEEEVAETIVVNGKTYSLSEEEGGSAEIPADDSEIGEDEEVGGGAEVEEDDTEYEVEETGDGLDDEEVSESHVHAELAEYKEAVKFLKDKLHEVNILNAKLLFTNKLFKEYALDNNQKLNVVETFDRAQTTREIKLVYSTLAEQFGSNGSINKRKSITESASSKSGSTKPSKKSTKVITEEASVANRFKKLAGIVKG